MGDATVAADNGHSAGASSYGVQLVRIGQLDENGASSRAHQYLPQERDSREAAADGASSTPRRKMKIDFVLTYQQQARDAGAGVGGSSSDEQMRADLLASLREEGVVVESAKSSTDADDDSDAGDGRGGGGSGSSSTRYLLLHATFPLLARFAEAIKLQMPLRDQSLGDEDAAQDGEAEVDVQQPPPAASSRSCRWSLWNAFRHPDDNSGDRNDLFTAPFQKNRLEMFAMATEGGGGAVPVSSSSLEAAEQADADGKDAAAEEFFTSAQRSLLLHTAMVSLPAFTRCRSAGAIRDAYPLHDGVHVPPRGALAGVAGCENDRQELHLLWVAAPNWWRFQPLMLIRRYFGEKVAMYFAWLGAYNTWLLPISLLGLAVFVYGLATVTTDEIVGQICYNELVGSLPMCPVCDGACDYWPLQQSCTYSCIVHVFDNKASVLFAGLVSLWATCFLEFWKRRQCVLQYQWDVATCEQDEVPRPDFKRTGLHIRGSRYCFSFVTVLFMVALVLAVLVGVITYRVAILVVFSSISSFGVFMSHLRLITTGTAACINFVCILLLNQVYKRLAMWLTTLERPRTETDFEDSYTIKMYCFQFVNYYSSLFYIAFLKGAFVGRPGDYARYPMLGGVRLEECDPAGCQVELVIQMLIVFVAKQVLSCVTEVGPPLLRKLLGKRANPASSGDAAAAAEPWVKDRALTPVTHLQLFDEYLEMVLQFGFVVLFVAAMPLAPLFAMVNNTLELRLDAWKMVALLRRPVARRARDIGAWLSILASVSALSVVTNAVIVGFTSEQIPKMVYQLTDGNGSLAGYMQWRLSLFNTTDFEAQSVPASAENVTDCYYRDFRYPPGHERRYEFSTAYWHVLAARMAFVLVFEHLVLMLKGLIDMLVPDKPAIVKQEMKRERELLRKALFAYRT